MATTVSRNLTEVAFTTKVAIHSPFTYCYNIYNVPKNTKHQCD